MLANSQIDSVLVRTGCRCQETNQRARGPRGIRVAVVDATTAHRPVATGIPSQDSGTGASSARFAAVLENVQDSGTSHMLIVRFGIMVPAVLRRVAQIEIVEQDAHTRQAGEVKFLRTLTASVYVVNLEHHAQDSHKPPEPDAIFHKDQIHLQGPSDALESAGARRS